MIKSIAKLLIFFCLLAFAYQSSALTLQYLILGLSDYEKLEKNVKSRLDAYLENLGKPSTQQSIQQAYPQMREEVREALSPFGYFKPLIQSRLEKKSSTQYVAVFEVHPGPPLRITNLNVKISGEGRCDRPFQRLLANFPLKPGDLFDAETYNKAKNDLFDIASRRGYIEAKMIKSEIAIHRQKYTADITIDFNTGPRYQYGPIDFSATPFAEEFLRRFIPACLQPGVPYRRSQIDLLHNNLSNSSYFQSVTVEPQVEKARNKQIPIKVNLDMRKQRQYIIGAGYGTDTGVRGILGMDYRYIGPWGHKFNTEIRASQIALNARANYIIPGRNPVTDKYIFSGLIGREDQINGSGFLQQLSANYLTALTTNWQQTLSLALHHENFEIQNQPSRAAFLLVPGVNWQYLFSDDPLRPTRGTRFNLKLLGGLSINRRTPDFFQTNLDIKRIQPLTRTNRLVLRGRIGYTEIKNIYELPLSFQLLAGGDQSVRGYTYNSIGPGKFLYVASAEFQQEVVKHWFLIAYSDIGAVSNRAWPRMDDEIKKSVGGGIMWQSPIGAISLSLAKALDGSGTRIIFTMGPEL